MKILHDIKSNRVYVGHSEDGREAYLHRFAAPHECVVDGCPGDIIRRKLALFDEMLMALEAHVVGFQSDPGISDLDDEQPIHIMVHLGEWRKTGKIIRKARELK
jgi:hypothetical protein